jgi:hypothetical protein
MKKSIGVTHVSALCKDCGKEFTSHTNGQALAAQHAKKYGHVVKGEVGLAFTYDGTESKAGGQS